MKHHFLWLSCMVECMWWGMVYNLVGFGGYVNLQIRPSAVDSNIRKKHNTLSHFYIIFLI